jgi:ATP-dependent DNA helicase RecG
MSYPIFHPDRVTTPPLLLSATEFASEFPGEGQYVEFKEGVSDNRIREAVVGFSNADGGVLIVGARDEGTVSGLASPGESERRMHEAIREVHNPGRYGVSRVLVEDNQILVLAVARRREGFSQMPNGAVRVRRGARNETLIGPDLSRFQQQRSFERFEDAATRSGLATVDAERVRSVSALYGIASGDFERSAIERGLATVENGRVRLTVAGALILTTEANEMVGRTGIEILRYSGDESEPDKRSLVTGAADEMVSEATARILDELGEQSVLVGVTRIDLPRLPATAVREAIANAVAHRSYESQGTHTRVEIRPGSVTITSPGTLPEPVTVEHMRTQQAARNPKVLEFLRRCGLAEDLGRGIDRIEDEMQAELLEAPEFSESPHSVTVTLHTRGLVSAEERAWVKRLIGDRLIESRDAVVALHAVRERSVTNSRVRDLLGVDSTEARLILQRLCAQGILVQEGERGGALYTPATALGATSMMRRSLDDLTLLVLEQASALPLSNADIREITGLDRASVGRLLTKLVGEGRLIRAGQRRGTRYRAPTTEPEVKGTQLAPPRLVQRSKTNRS